MVQLLTVAIKVCNLGITGAEDYARNMCNLLQLHTVLCCTHVGLNCEQKPTLFNATTI